MNFDLHNPKLEGKLMLETWFKISNHIDYLRINLVCYRKKINKHNGNTFECKINPIVKIWNNILLLLYQTGVSEPVSSVIANPIIKSYKNIFTHDQKLMMCIVVLSGCQLAASCILFIDIYFCEENVLPLTTLTGAGKPNQQC